MRNQCICVPGYAYPYNFQTFAQTPQQLLDSNMSSILNTASGTKQIEDGNFWGHSINVYTMGGTQFGNVWGWGSDYCFMINTSGNTVTSVNYWTADVIGHCGSNPNGSLSPNSPLYIKLPILQPSSINSYANMITSANVPDVSTSVLVIIAYITKAYANAKGLTIPTSP